MLGPIVGHVTATTARIWLQGETVDGLAYRIGNAPWKVLPAQTNAALSNTTVVDVAGLEPGTDYQYVFQRGGSDVSAARGQFSTFQAKPDHFSFLLASCHKATDASSDAEWERWSALGSEVWANDMLILCGDQVYEWDIANDRTKTKDALFAAREALYQAAWKDARFREVTSFIPTYMMWDDHEIRDDWGSRPGDWTGEFEKQLFQTAENAYQRYQNAHNPPGYNGKRHYGFTIGRLGFFFLDLRGERGKDPEYPLLGKAQFNDFLSWVSSVVGKIDLLFVVSSVPIAHASIHAAALAQSAGLALKLDTADAWNSGSNGRDLDRVLDTLFHLQCEGMVRQCFVLGGDVHVATWAEIHSEHPQHKKAPVIHQFTSSPLSNSAPEWIAAVGSGLFIRGTVELRPGYKSVNKRYLARRNFGRIQLTRAATGKWTVGFELAGQGDGVLSAIANIEV